MILKPMKCWRGKDDCEPMHAIEGLPDDLTEEQMETGDFAPISFVCCGINHSSSREVKQDCYRLCFKNDIVDDMTDNDEQDLTHILAVVSQTLAIVATRRVNSGVIEVPAMQGDAP
jgi:hypothetical protein